MTPSFASTHVTEAPIWLQEKVYAPRRQRTIALVKRSVDALVAVGQRVSLASVAAHSQQIDPDGRGVSESAILGNDEARAYYEAYRTWPGARRRPPAPVSRGVISPPQPVKLTRDVRRVRQRYWRMGKDELVERLVALEQAHAAQEERWLRVNDELLTWRLRAERAEAQLAREHPAT